MPGRSVKAQSRDARRRKLAMRFHKMTGRGFDEDWSPLKDKHGNFAADTINLYKDWAINSPEKLNAEHARVRNDVISAYKQGKELVDYEQNSDGSLTHLRESMDGKISAIAKAYNEGGRDQAEGVKLNSINQARQRVILGLATKSDLVELYRYDHTLPEDNSIKAQLNRAFDELFDNDFFDGFRFGLGNILQIGAPLLDYVPGAAEVGLSGYVEEAGKYIEGGLDADKIIANQNRRNGVDSERDAGLARQETFDPAAAIAEDVIKKKEEEERVYQEAYSADRYREYNDSAVDEYVKSQGITQQQYDERALPTAEYEKKYGINQPVIEPGPIQAEDGTNDVDYPVLPEGEEFKQAPVDESGKPSLTPEAVAAGATSGSSNSNLETGIRELNRKVDDLSNSVNGVIARAKERKAKSGGGLRGRGAGLKTGGGSGPRDRGNTLTPPTDRFHVHSDVSDALARESFAFIDRQIQEERRELVQAEERKDQAEIRYLTERIGHLQTLLRRIHQGLQNHRGGPDRNELGNTGEGLTPSERNNPHEPIERPLEQDEIRRLRDRIEVYRDQIRLLEDQIRRGLAGPSAQRYIAIYQNSIRAVQAQLANHTGEGLKVGGAGSGKRKRRGISERPRHKPLSPADLIRLNELEEELAEIEFGNGDPAREPVILDEIRRINGREIEELNREYDDHVGGGLVKRKREDSRFNPDHGPNAYNDPATVRRWEEVENRLQHLFINGGPFGANGEEVRRLFVEQEQLRAILQRQDDRVGRQGRQERGLWRFN